MNREDAGKLVWETSVAQNLVEGDQVHVNGRTETVVYLYAGKSEILVQFANDELLCPLDEPFEVARFLDVTSIVEEDERPTDAFDFERSATRVASLDAVTVAQEDVAGTKEARHNGEP